MSAGQTPITEQLWYYLDKEDNNSKTLIHFRALVRLYELRKVDKHTQIWRETMEGWLPIHSVPELYQALKQLSGVPEEPEWMYIDPSSGVQKGPCTVVEFKGLLASAPSSSASSSTSASTVTINQDTYGWRQGMSAWVRLVEIPELQHIFAEGTGSSASTGASVSSSSAPALTADGLPVFGIEGGAAVEWHFIAAAAAATTASTSSQLGPVSLFSLVEDYVTLQQQERRKEKEKEEPGSTASYPRLPSLKYRITDDTMCWKAGMAEWSPFKSVPDLTAAVKKYIFSSRKAQKKLGKKKKRKTPGSSSVAHTSNNNNITSSTAGAGDQHAKKQKSASSSPSDMDTDSSGRADAGSSSSTATASNGKKKKWKSTEKHNNIYVTGLPGDATLDEMYEFFKKCGVIKEDHTGKPRIKLYTLTNSNSGGGDDDKSKSNGHGGGDGGGGQLKGDGLVCYLRPESVSLALDLLDQSPFRPLTHPSKLIRVQKAEFTMKGKTFDASKHVVKESKEELKLLKLKQKAKQLNLLDWAEEGAEIEEKVALSALAKSGLMKMKIVVLKHMFSPREAQQCPEGEAAFYTELKVEVGMEVEKKVGKIEKVHVFEGSSEGVISVKFVTALSAARCIQLFDGRWFGGQKLECNYFDGKTDYRVRESEEKQKQRLEDFGKWLEE